MLLTSSPLTTLAVLAIGLTCSTKSEFLISFKKCLCIVHDPQTIQNVTCSAKAVNRTTAVLNLHGNLVRQIDNAYIHMQLFKVFGLHYRPFLVNVTENYCNVFSKNHASRYMRMLLSIYLKYTNLNHKCPYMGPVYIENLVLSAENLPDWIAGTFRMDVRIFQPKRNIITLQFFSEVKEVRKRII